MAETVGGAGAAPGNGEAQQQLVVNAQYVKDLSFENPRAPQSLMQQAQPPEVQIGVDVKAQTLGQDIYEVLLTINANAKSGADAVFMVELTYAALVTARVAPQE